MWGFCPWGPLSLRGLLSGRGDGGPGHGRAGQRFYLSASTPDVLFYGQVLVLGIACGLLSILVCYTFSGVRAGLARLFPNPYLRVVVGSAGVMVLTLILGTKTYLGTGEALIAQAIDQGRAVPQDCFLKLLLTALTLGAGLKGGEIVPCFAIGASFGCVVGPLLGLPAPYAAAVGMVALFCGVTNCPLTALCWGLRSFSSATRGLSHGGGRQLSGLWVQWTLRQAKICLFQDRPAPEGLAHEARRERTGPL